MNPSPNFIIVIAVAPPGKIKETLLILSFTSNIVAGHEEYYPAP